MHYYSEGLKERKIDLVRIKKFFTDIKKKYDSEYNHGEDGKNFFFLQFENLVCNFIFFCNANNDAMKMVCLLDVSLRSTDTSMQNCDDPNDVPGKTKMTEFRKGNNTFNDCT